MVGPLESACVAVLADVRTFQAHVCISNTSRAGAEMGYDVSVVRDGIGDRDIPGATAKQLVDVCLSSLPSQGGFADHEKRVSAKLGLI